MDQALELMEEVVCPECGYDLRGIGSERCPECGQTIDRTELSLSRIPWEHRRKIGWMRAYWRTVGMAVFRPGKLAREVARPVTYADAWRFRAVTVVLAASSMVAWIVAMREELDKGLGDWLDRYWPIGPIASVVIQGLAGRWMEVGAYMGVLLSLAGTTGMVGWFCRPQRLSVIQQNRAVAVSQYACAAMAFSPLALILALASKKAGVVHLPRISISAGLLCWFLLGFELVSWWCSTLWIMRVSTRCGTGRMLITGIVLPILAIVATLMAVGGLSLLLGYFALLVSLLGSQG